MALHLDLDGQAGDDGGVLTIEGVAEVEAGPLADPDRSPYLDKYRETMRNEGFAPEEALAEFSAVIRVRPIRVRSY